MVEVDNRGDNYVTWVRPIRSRTGGRCGSASDPMRSSGTHRVLLRLILLVLATAVLANASETVAEDPLFAQDRVVVVEIEVGSNDIARLQAKPRAYVPGRVSVDGQAFSPAQVHLKGHGSYQPVHEKPNLMVRLETAAAKRTLGHRRLLLNNSRQDGSFIRWKLASELFLKVGLPAARVNFSRVTLNGRNLGLYVLVEPTDKNFLARQFGSATGTLYEGSNTDIEDDLELDSRGATNQYEDLRALSNACQEPDLQQRWQRLRGILDADRFAAFMAMEVLICHHDGYALDRNNFRVYHDPRTEHLVFIPHGMDLIFDEPQLPLDGRWRGTVARSLMETSEGKRLYRQRLTDLARRVYGSRDMRNRIAALAKFLGSQFSRSDKDGQQMARQISQLDQVVGTRARFVFEQLGLPADK